MSNKKKRLDDMKSLTNLTSAFVIHANFSKYKILGLIKPEKFIQERADAVGAQIRIKAEHGEWKRYKYTHVVEVYGSDAEQLLGVRRAIGNYLSWANPNYSYCRRCHVIWSSAKPHATNFRRGGGCFSLCEWCWEQLTPEQRLPYYEIIILNWESMAYKPISEEEKEDYTAIRKAVLAGK